jgi:hypothetical protein
LAEREDIVVTGRVVLILMDTDGGLRAVLHPDCDLFATVVVTLLEQDANLRALLATLCARATRDTANGEASALPEVPPPIN